MKSINFQFDTFFQTVFELGVLAILLFIPFQAQLTYIVPKIIINTMWIDEVVTLLMFFGIAAVLFYNHKIPRPIVPLFGVVIIFSFLGVLSGFYNGDKWYVTLYGIFDYIKNFIPIFIFVYFKVSEKKFKLFYNIMLSLAIFFCLVSIWQEAKYLYNPVGYDSIDIRFGLYRTFSVLSHPNILGLYSLFFFILDYSVYKKVRLLNIILLLGVFLSISRMVWVAAFLSFLLLQISFKKAKKVFLFGSVVLVCLFYVFFGRHTAEEMDPRSYYRGYVLHKSVEIWKDYPVLGAGPGKYGGVGSLEFKSPIYKKHNFEDRWYNYGLKNFHSLDMFWPQILVEMGLAGTVCFSAFLIVLWLIAKRASDNALTEFQKSMLIGFSIVPIVIFFYLSGSGLNLTAFLLTYSIIFGMLLGIKKE